MGLCVSKNEESKLSKAMRDNFDVVSVGSSSSVELKKPSGDLDGFEVLNVPENWEMIEIDELIKSLRSGKEIFVTLAQKEQIEKRFAEISHTSTFGHQSKEWTRLKYLINIRGNDRFSAPNDISYMPQNTGL